MRTLLMFSGGIDSAYCLYLALRDGENVQAHHIRLVNADGRADAEGRAVERVREWLAAQGLPGRAHYTESVFDYGSIGALPEEPERRWLHADTWAWLLTAGLILADPAAKRLTRLIMPIHKGGGFLRVPHRWRAQKAMVRAVARREIGYLWPLRELTKAEIVRACPPELRELCWHCRQPTPEGAPCHECQACVWVDEALP